MNGDLTRSPQLKSQNGKTGKDVKKELGEESFDETDIAGGMRVRINNVRFGVGVVDRRDRELAYFCFLSFFVLFCL